MLASHRMTLPDAPAIPVATLHLATGPLKRQPTGVPVPVPLPVQVGFAGPTPAPDIGRAGLAGSEALFELNTKGSSTTLIPSKALGEP